MLPQQNSPMCTATSPVRTSALNPKPWTCLGLRTCCLSSWTLKPSSPHHRQPVDSQHFDLVGGMTMVPTLSLEAEDLEFNV